MNAYLINTETKEWPFFEGNVRNMFPNTSFPNPMSDPPEPFAWVQDTEVPVFNPDTQTYAEISPQLDADGKWKRVFKIIYLSQEEINALAEAKQKRLKQQNKDYAQVLLQETDWTENASVRNTAKTPHLVNGDAFDDYRVALRAIAVNPPVTVSDWPVKPDEVWS